MLFIISAKMLFLCLDFVYICCNIDCNVFDGVLLKLFQGAPAVFGGGSVFGQRGGASAGAASFTYGAPKR